MNLFTAYLYDSTDIEAEYHPIKAEHKRDKTES